MKSFHLVILEYAQYLWSTALGCDNDYDEEIMKGTLIKILNAAKGP